MPNDENRGSPPPATLTGDISRFDAAAILPHESVMSRDSTVDRRAFMRVVAASAGAMASAALFGRARPNALAPNRFGLGAVWTAPVVLRIGLVVMPSGDPGFAARVASCRRGAELGIEEASRAATLLGTRLEVEPVAEGREAARALIASRRVAATIVAAPASEIVELGTPSGRDDLILMNCLADDDTLRNAACTRTAFHVAASQAMIADATRAAEPDGSADGNHAGPSSVELWHGSLERFGAAQLNDRFRARFGVPMDSAAWAGWFAVKTIWEASQRSRSVDPSAIVNFLERDTTAFDGHKGVPLSFRPWDHQLRQPLYVVSAPSSSSPEVRTAPKDPAPSRDALDALGATARTTRCQWR